MATLDLITEAARSISRRRLRSAATALGTIIGVAAIVATTGLASTLQGQVSDTFNELNATEVRLSDATPDGTNPFPTDVDARLEALNGVNHAGITWPITTAEAPRLLLTDPDRADSPLTLVAASPGALLAARPTIIHGRLYDQFHLERGEHVAVIGATAARQLGLTRIDNQPAVFVGTNTYTVIGIIDSLERDTDLLQAVIVPTTTATADYPTSGGDAHVLIDVTPGAAQLIGHQAADALRPQQPDRLATLIPPDPRTLRRNVETNLTSLFYGLAGLALIIGAIGIANTTLVAVMERRPEIGVRRALGAKRSHILAQFLTEATALGAAGGAIGTLLGTLAVAAYATTQHWAPTINPTIPIAAPAIGALTGLAAGIYPARKAAKTNPIDALR